MTRLCLILVVGIWLTLPAKESEAKAGSPR